MSLVWFVMSIILILSIVGYPLGIKFLKIGYTIWKPFGKDVVIAVERYPIFNFLWSISIGLFLFSFCVVSGLLSIASIFGIPLTKQWIKIAKLSIFPFGAIIK